ncbi:uncharacterized protein LOC135483689 [Lineus longissimus]|uniref:uncharacterized protein LOC135483689 n=1 Tax=Lineus longissimus TaxID=88925 RepID=UPI00315C6880
MTNGDYCFEFSFKGKSYCINANTDDGSLGRLINDSHDHFNIKPPLGALKWAKKLDMIMGKESSHGTMDSSQKRKGW